MTLAQIKTMFIEILSSWFSNKKVLDKLSENTDGNLLFDGQEIKSSSGSDITISEEDNNAIQQKDDGIFVEDKSEQIDSIHEQVNRVSIAQKTINTEHDYFYGRGNVEWVTVSGDITKYFNNNRKNTNMNINENNHIVLKAGKKYLITCEALSNTSGSYLYIKMNGTPIGEQGYHANVHQTQATALVFTEEDSLLSIVTTSNNSICFSHAWLSIQEIGHDILIDPVEHINKTQGIEDTPVGHIISHMGNKAPKHYLICDGTEYNISDYPYLAQHFKDEFGSYNYFGGDGTTTFAVPDLRGEFLRGTGTATRNTGTGVAVGVHQDGSLVNGCYATREWNFGVACGPWDYSAMTKSNMRADTYIKASVMRYTSGTTYNASEMNIGTYTTRPTNTSVLYCIKYEPTYFMNINNTGATNYSEEEQIIGTWIDGKPLYRKVLVLTTPSSVDSTKDYEIDKTYIVHNIQGYIDNGNNINHCIPLNFYVNNTYVFTRVRENLDSLNISITLSKDLSSTTNKSVYVIIEYTKTTD